MILWHLGVVIWSYSYWLKWSPRRPPDLLGGTTRNCGRTSLKTPLCMRRGPRLRPSGTCPLFSLRDTNPFSMRTTPALRLKETWSSTWTSWRTNFRNLCLQSGALGRSAGYAYLYLGTGRKVHFLEKQPGILGTIWAEKSTGRQISRFIKSDSTGEVSGSREVRGGEEWLWVAVVVDIGTERACVPVVDACIEDVAEDGLQG